MKDSLRSISFNKFKSSPISYLSVGIMCGLFLIIATVLAFIEPLILIVAVPLIALPFLFASHVACYYLQINQQINPSAFLRYFVGFFRSQFRGSFRGLISFLKSLGFYFAMFLIGGFVLYLIFKANYGATFTDSFNRLVYLYMSNQESALEDIIATLNDNDGLLLTFIVYISVIAIPLAMLAFVYYISFSSISIYYRTNVLVASAPLLKMSVNSTYSLHHKSMRKDWFLLNWPILALSLLGMALFVMLDLFFVRRIDLLPAFVIVGGVALLMFYLPFYFANMETIYKKYEPYFKEGNQRAIENILLRIQNSIELSEEEKKHLEESLRGANKDDKEE